ncbi:MAG: type II secretion system protein M [Desulfuromonadaceae bacterium]|nr:type II secretion system protein M [Desulfuromonadaceae bacterium]
MIHNFSTREQLFIAGGALFCLACLVYFAVIQPYRSSIHRLDSRIASRSAQLHQVQQFERDYQQLQQQISAVQERSRQNKNFALFSFIENRIIHITGREKLTAMRPLAPTVHDQMTEESVEIHLEKIDLAQVVRLLEQVDQSPVVLKVKKLHIKKRFDDPGLLDTLWHISAFQEK